MNRFLHLKALELIITFYFSIFYDILEENQKALEDVDDYVTNPIAALKLVRRLAVDWSDIKEVLTENSFLELFKVYEKSWPDLSDVKGAAGGITRIQTFYNLKTKDLVKGELQGQYFGNKLSGDECFEIGQEYFKMEEFYRSIDWFKEAKRLSLNTIQPEYIVRYLALAYGKIGKYSHALRLIHDELDDDHNNKHSLMQYYKQSILLKNTTSSNKNEDKQENNICQGNLKNSPIISRDLFCMYGHFDEVLFLRIAPFKMEYLCIDPPIMQFYDVITDAEIEYMKQYATPHLIRSTISYHEEFISDLRVSKGTGLGLHDHDFLEDFKQRLGDITGADTYLSEPLQIANYGVGGYYNEHHDFIELPTRSNRLLTALYYVSII